MAIVKKDYAGLVSGLEKTLRAKLTEYLGDSAAQLDGPIRRAAENMALSAQRGRKDLVDEAKDTLMVAIQERKLSAKAGLSDLLRGFLEQGIPLLVDGAIAGLGGLRIVP